MAGLDRKSFLLGLGASTLALAPTSASAQFPNPTSILRGAQRRVQASARDAAEQAVARTLFPLEDESNQFLRQYPKFDTRDFGPFLPMNQLARTPTGGFVLRPGAWTFTAQSYCLKVGTYERTGGAGYRSGPLGGKMADTVYAILQSSYAHPEVRQPDVQRLLWSFLAGVSYNELPLPEQNVARILLEPEQLRKANSAALEIPDVVSNAVLSRLPPLARELINTRQRLRAAASRPSTSFSDLERIAVLAGVPPRTGQETPAGRWSWNPKGYFIRYFSESYSKTTVEIMVGDALTIRRDAKRRIVQWSLADGRRIDLTYRDDLGPLRFRRAPNLALHFFRNVRYTFPSARGPVTINLANKGYTFLADPRRARRGASILTPERARFDLAAMAMSQQTMCQTLESEVIDGLTEDVRDRLIDDAVDASGSRLAQIVNEALDRQEAIDDLRELGDPAEEIDNLGDAEHLREGVTTIVVGDTSDRLGFIADFHRSLARALAGATALLDGMSGSADGGGSGGVGGGGGGGGGGPTFDPPGSPGYPTGRGQIRGVSGREF